MQTGLYDNKGLLESPSKSYSYSKDPNKVPLISQAPPTRLHKKAAAPLPEMEMVLYHKTAPVSSKLYSETNS